MAKKKTGVLAELAAMVRDPDFAGFLEAVNGRIAEPDNPTPFETWAKQNAPDATMYRIDDLLPSGANSRRR